jgi:ABC-type cobalamin/Fe3+-siderophores transport system ATPase subunit
MNYKYLYLTFFIFLGLATLAHAEAYFLDDPTRNLPEKNAVEVLQLNRYANYKP